MGTLLWSTESDGERSTDDVVAKAIETKTETTGL